MKRTVIEKAVESATLTPQQLEAINRYSRRTLKAEEVYVFSIILCDNDIDRDGERFPRESLEKLAVLFAGKTGVFDHRPTAQNQSARIFETQVEKSTELNSLGKPLYRLRAWAYMVRCDKNADLILEIDAGIKKEVSVGCSVEKTLCSICGHDVKAGACDHHKGQEYGGEICHYLLTNPTDAYEWSFVAVPAQRNAGVTKKAEVLGGDEGTSHREDAIEKLFSAEDDLLLTKTQVMQLQKRYDALKELAREGQAYADTLRRETVRLTLLAQPEMDAVVMEEVASAMDIRQMKAYCKVFRNAAEKQAPICLQLGGGKADKKKGDSLYVI